MVYEIVLRKRFQKKYLKLLEYLETEFGFKVASDFQSIIFNRFYSLQSQPYLGKPSVTIAGMRSIVPSKHNRIYYKIAAKKIIIVNMYDTRMNPKRNRYDS